MAGEWLVRLADFEKVNVSWTVEFHIHVVAVVAVPSKYHYSCF